jgi:nicotinamidase-related amidase
MPLTQLDPTAALIVIDLQKGIVGMPTAHPIAEIVERNAQLARAFRERGLPVVLVNVTLFLNWSNNLAITSSPSSEWALSSAHRSMKPCAGAA